MSSLNLGLEEEEALKLQDMRHDLLLQAWIWRWLPGKVCGWLLWAESGSQLPASKVSGTTALSLQQTVLCQLQKDKLGSYFSPKASRWNLCLTPSFQTYETLRWETSHSVPRPLMYGDCNIINLCCFKILGL